MSSGNNIDICESRGRTVLENSLKNSEDFSSFQVNTLACHRFHGCHGKTGDLWVGDKELITHVQQ